MLEPSGPRASVRAKPADGQSYFVYVGCRTTRERNARGDGINVYRMDAASGKWSHVQLLEGVLNPSFLAFDRNGRFLYTIHGDSTEISAYSADPQTGRIAFINKQPTKGKNPVHDPSGRFMFVANEDSDRIVKFEVDKASGRLTATNDVVKTGSPVCIVFKKAA